MGIAEPMPFIKLVDCVNTVVVTHMSYPPPDEPRIEKVDEGHYMVVRTGEVFEYGERSSTKGDNRKSLLQSFSRLKMVINCNYVKPSWTRFLTLTYRDNMTDNSRISVHLRRFWPRMHELYGAFEYVYVKERQARGAWHVHAVLFFDRKAPFMSNDDVAAAWGRGFVNVQGFRDNINNLGNYLCAYLTDGGRNTKKGERLCNYEAGIRLFNCSSGVRRPRERRIDYWEYVDMVTSGSVMQLSKREADVFTGEGRKPLKVQREIYAVL